ncbi:MAG: hypothetical protein Ct9H90mP22_0380 [Gammaproteobacteria bacterium]|nr:MAG: hypothetical protein Ct9H90mP22_0380 [Gammaproteobacteria bacterium]
MDQIHAIYNGNLIIRRYQSSPLSRAYTFSEVSTKSFLFFKNEVIAFNRHI